jgi:hypothetical protein
MRTTIAVVAVALAVSVAFALSFAPLLLIFPFQSHSPSDPSIHYLQSSAFNLCPFQPGPLFFLSKPVAGSPAPDPSTDGVGEGSGAGEQPKVIRRQVGSRPWLAVVARLYRGQRDPRAGGALIARLIL